jgi:hypothetical protein
VGTIRPEIMALRSLKIEIDESGNGVEKEVFIGRLGTESARFWRDLCRKLSFSHEFSPGGSRD